MIDLFKKNSKKCKTSKRWKVVKLKKQFMILYMLPKMLKT